MKLFRFLPMTAVMGLIFLLSHTPGDSLPPALPGLDKVCHAIAYGTLAASCLYALHPVRGKTSFFRLGAAVVFFCFLYGLTDEFHQSFIPGRSPSGLDIVADTAGAALVVFIRHRWRHIDISRSGKALGRG
ncbi:MAG: VanZ family protein [Deltaproteobacteria bacterium]|nr:VanZ family protein [Deltaproteobacteria bacterium]